MSGKVYFYNLVNEPAKLSLNGGPAGTINALGAEASGYQPSFIPVDSVRHADEWEGKVFRGGEDAKKGINSITIQYDSGTASGQIHFPTPDDGVGIDRDLLCFLAKNVAIVEPTPDGFVWPLTNGNQPLDFEEGG